MVQLKSIGFTMVFAPVMTFFILGALRMFGSLRVAEEEEFEGLDVSAHSESAYAFGTGATVGAAAHGAPSGSFAASPVTQKA